MQDRTCEFVRTKTAVDRRAVIGGGRGLAMEVDAQQDTSAGS
jgi:hypothetical protein